MTWEGTWEGVLVVEGDQQGYLPLLAPGALQWDDDKAYRS